MTDITPAVPVGRQLIQTYGAGGFRIAGRTLTGSVIVFPDRTVPWDAKSYESISPQTLSAVMDAATDIEVLLIGCGARFGLPRPDIRKALKAVSVVPEWMDTGAACRTFNVLLSEDRAVAAALIAVE
jgi:uncharacterized protein